MKKVNKIKFWGIFVLIFLLLLSSGCGKDNTTTEEKPVENVPETPKIKIVDTNSKTRPYAVMVNNLNVARGVQSGLSEAYMVYEIIVEGGITRYLALFKDADVAKIGSVRSARHYFLDYVLENDAIFVHWGYSDQAKKDIKSLKINNINGLTYEGTYFYRDNSLNISSEHTGFTKTEMIDKAVNKLKYRKETNTGLLLDYNAESLDLTSYASISDANTVTLKYSSYITNKYVYDAQTKMYLRYVNNKEQIDNDAKKQIAVKNIIVYEVENSTIKGDTSGRQNLDNIGSGSGYYITEGKAVKINWSKKDRASKTIYTYEDGTELVVNDGNTFIQIMPKTGKVTME